MPEFPVVELQVPPAATTAPRQACASLTVDTRRVTRQSDGSITSRPNGFDEAPNVPAGAVADSIDCPVTTIRPFTTNASREAPANTFVNLPRGAWYVAVAVASATATIGPSGETT